MSEPPKPPAAAGDAATGQPPADARTRREFLKASAAVTGASLLGGCLTDTYEPKPVAPGIEPVQRFEHVVAVMFENRSLDNLLGYLYASGQVPRDQTYDGIPAAGFSNPVPDYIDDGHASVATRVSPGTDADYSNPNPDPGEEYQHVNTQLFGIVDPPTNAFLKAADMTAPYNAPAPGQVPAMQGFVHDYCNNFRATSKPMRNPTFDEYRVIMDGFSPDQLPVLSTLAREFAVYDAWFCAVPTQTFCNRSFFHASASSGNVVNAPYSKWLLNVAPTIFNRLEDAGIPWKIYFDPLQIISLTGLIHAPALVRVLEDPVRDHGHLLQRHGQRHAARLRVRRAADCSSTTTTTIRRRALADIDHIPIGATSDVRAGDLLLHQIYGALRTSASHDGLERAQHADAGDLRRARRDLRPRRAAGGAAAVRPAAAGRVRLCVRPLRRAGAGDRHFGAHGGEHGDPSADEPRGADPHAVREARAAASDRARPQRPGPLRCPQPRRRPRALRVAGHRAAPRAAGRARDRSAVADARGTGR